jgi:hypothetical protein
MLLPLARAPVGREARAPVGREARAPVGTGVVGRPGNAPCDRVRAGSGAP